nr:hypothetical protein [Candidatus Sigynarchaeota archaeon]
MVRKTRATTPRGRQIRDAVAVACMITGLAFPALYFTFGNDLPLVLNAFRDPFMLDNGTRVSNVPEWETRRAEIKELLLGTEYGHMPGRPDAMNATAVSIMDLGNGRTLHVVTLIIIPSNATPAASFSFTATIFVPNGTGPFPAVVKVGLDSQGSQAAVNQTIMDHGYLFACYKNTELDQDTEGYDEVGPAQAAYPGYDWGSVAVWAWGAMRVADYLLGEPWVNTGSAFKPDVDPRVVVVTGHSRRGKTALLAAALDERFTMAVPNGSGTGGASSFLVQGPGAETLASITSPYLFKSWFKDDFGRFAWNEAQLPFDQHFLRALVAPRVVISTDALGDIWSNPAGTQAVHVASQPVFDFLNASACNGIHFREGGHDFTVEDFAVLLDFADTMLRGKSCIGNFYMHPFTFIAPVYYTVPGSR